MKIAITGGTGLLGRYLLRCLNERGIQKPIVFSRQKNNPLNYAEIRTTDYSFSSLIGVLSDVDTVVHLAAQRGSYANLKDYQMNIDITQSLYEACIRKKISNIIYASTIAVYSKDLPLPWNEQHPPAPETVYGISKMCSEHVGSLYTRQYGLKVKNLRFPPLLGIIDERDKMKTRMINQFMRQAIAKETLVLLSRSNAQREFLYAKDAAQAILSAIEAKANQGTFNVGSGEALTNQEIAERINKAFCNEGNLRIEDREVKPVESSYMTSEKAFTQLGFKAQYSLHEAMNDIYKEMQCIKNILSQY